VKTFTLENYGFIKYLQSVIILKSLEFKTIHLHILRTNWNFRLAKRLCITPPMVVVACGNGCMGQSAGIEMTINLRVRASAEKFPGEAKEKTRPKNSTIKPSTTFSVSCIKIHGPPPLLSTAEAHAPWSYYSTSVTQHTLATNDCTNFIRIG